MSRLPAHLLVLLNSEILKRIWTNYKISKYRVMLSSECTQLSKKEKVRVVEAIFRHPHFFLLKVQRFVALIESVHYLYETSHPQLLAYIHCPQVNS